MRCKEETRGGGLMLLFKDQKSICVQQAKTKLKDILIVKGMIKKYHITIILVDLSVVIGDEEKKTNGDIKKEIRKQIEECEDEELIILLGDFNGHIGILGDQQINHNGKPMFWHDIWVSCNKPESGWVYAIMKKNRKVYHYKLRGLKKLRQSKIKLSVSRSMMTSKNRNYWKSARAVRKNRYNNTPVVDGIHGNSEIANVFKSKFSALYSSVPTTTEAMESLNENIDINVRNHCTDNANETDVHTHCHVIERNHVKSAIDKLKSSKIDQNGCIFSDSIIHGTELLFDYVCILFNAMICHSYAPPSFIKSSIIPISKGTKATLTDSDKYRSIAISSILSKVLDYIIIDNQKLALQTSDYQFGFKSKSSTVLCTTMVTETIQYYTENGCKGVFLLLLDASKAFDKVVFHMLFNELIKKNVCTKIIKLLLYMYTNQDCDVQWEGAHSNMFKIFNGVKQGSVISPLLFTLYIDSLFLLLKQLGLGCHVGLTYAGAFGYADDIALVAPSSSRILESETIESSHWLLTKRLHFRTKFPNLYYCLF